MRSQLMKAVNSVRKWSRSHFRSGSTYSVCQRVITCLLSSYTRHQWISISCLETITHKVKSAVYLLLVYKLCRLGLLFFKRSFRQCEESFLASHTA